MSGAAEPGLRRLAWNGIFLNAPASWEAGVLEKDYFAAHHERAPVMEIKWNLVRGRFDPEAYLARLARKFKRKAVFSLSRKGWPEDWRAAFTSLDGRGYPTAGFTWQAEDGAGGKGAAVYCPKCGRAALIQFFEGRDRRSENLWPLIIRSYGDHRDDGRVEWAVFDMHAFSPLDLGLEAFSFKPGHFELEFSGKRARLKLERIAPAQVVLKGRDLAEWARDFWPQAENALSRPTENGHEFFRKAGGAKAFLARVRPAKARPFGLFRAWLASGGKRIQAVGFETPRPPDEELFGEICDSYELV